MYGGDSFFTLDIPGQLGLVALSLVLGILMILLTRHLTRRANRVLRIATWAGLFAGFLWLSPQVYYAYYRAIIPGLPVQWVIRSWPDVFEALRLLLFIDDHNLSAHGRGVLGWLMLVTALLVLPGRNATRQEDD